jgi:transcription-repair coupling factor (superfamily II helicase)
MLKNEMKEFLIVALSPDFLERDVFWFSENENKIKKALRTDAFWQNHALFIEVNENIKLSEFLRKLDDLNYTKVMTVSCPGEFSTRGGLITIFPINKNNAILVDFFGNSIDKITELKNIKVSEKKKEKILKKQILLSDSSRLKNIKSGDFIVHIDHGIGIFKGKTKLNKNEEEPEYFLLEYAPPKNGKNPDKLFVPKEKANKLSLYLGFRTPTIHRLSGNTWEKAFKKASEDAEKFAKELLRLYSKRSITKRQPYQKDDIHQQEFEDSFEYVETEDQKRSIEEIKKDMEKDIPMDRLLCGDVGFGKTEVAMCAAFKAVNSGLQVAILCPTTILSDQHYENFKKRFEKFPISIGALNRFESKESQKETIQKIKEGKIDIVIGTHRALSSDIIFQKLGLLIIDEEQRFGVKQKEKLKKFREELDVLSLSATPIPRTLYLSLSGLRQISTIDTPPFGRIPINTIVTEYDKKIIKAVIKKELARKGQVYFLHNRIETIDKTFSDLKKLLPKVSFNIAHGRLSEHTLRSVMKNFKEDKFDVLIATTIIENGLDIKNVNTLIVDDATRLGLSQAHQIRGRIGRHTQEAFAYFLYRKKSLTENGKKRLEALEKYSKIGSGYQLALKDLEIRGAGNILGKKQSGTINQIGLNLYCEMLNQAIEKLRQ